MNCKTFTILVIGFCITVSAFAAEKLAVAEPVAKGDVSAAEISSFWGILESSIHSNEYKLISRGALKQMLTEIGLVNSSGLVNMNSAQKAKMGQLETVKYILVSELGRFGTKINCTMRILDASTGEINTARTANLRVNTMDELADRIEATLQKLLSDNKQLARVALLYPDFRITGAPAYLAAELNNSLEIALLSQGVKMQNLQNISLILKKNRIDNLNALEPKMYVRIGQLLEVQILIQTTITRFEFLLIPYHVEESGASGIRKVGNFEGNIRIISTRTGEILASVPFAEKVNFRTVSRSITKDWTPNDYGKHLVQSAVRNQIIPSLKKVPQLKGNAK